MGRIREFAAVSRVLSPYLHLDWDIDFDSGDDALAAAIQDADVQHLEAAVVQMPQLIDLVRFARNELDLNSLFVALGLGYNPSYDGRSRAEWLQYVQSCMTRELAARTSRGK